MGKATKGKTAKRARGQNTREWTCVAVSVKDNERLAKIVRAMSKGGGRVARKTVITQALDLLETRLDELNA